MLNNVYLLSPNCILFIEERGGGGGGKGSQIHQITTQEEQYFASNLPPVILCDPKPLV